MQGIGLRGHLTFCTVAERPSDGSRGFQAAVAGRKQGIRRGATVEIKADEIIQASLRDATMGDLARGLKSTATIQASLREVWAVS